VVELLFLGRKRKRKKAPGKCFSEKLNVDEALADGDLAKRGTNLAWE